jgi:hypothetical protein
MLSVELTHLTEILDQTRQLGNVSQQAKEWSSRIQDAIWETTVILNPNFLPGTAYKFFADRQQYLRV